jgi:hypothetical protein
VFLLWLAVSGLLQSVKLWRMRSREAKLIGGRATSRQKDAA